MKAAAAADGDLGRPIDILQRMAQTAIGGYFDERILRSIGTDRKTMSHIMDVKDS